MFRFTLKKKKRLSLLMTYKHGINVVEVKHEQEL